MTSSIGSIGTSSASTSSSTSSSSSSAQKLSDETKNKLKALGVDTTSITSEAQGQIALLQAQQQQKAQGGEKSKGGDAGKAEMESIKTEATSLASKLGITVSKDEKVQDIMAAIGPAVEAKVSAAGTDQNKIAEAQALQTEFSTISSSLSNMEAQHSKSAQAPAANQTSAFTADLGNMAAQNQLYHKVGS